MKYLVGVDGSRVADQAFSVAASLMDRWTDELVIVNVYKTHSHGMFVFRFRDHPTDIVQPGTVLFIEHNQIYTLTRRVLDDTVESEEVILFIDSKPIFCPEATKAEPRTLDMTGHEVPFAFNGDFFQEDFNGVIIGRPNERRGPNLYFVETKNHSYSGHGGDKDDIKKYADDLAPANQPGHLKQLYERKCGDAHVQKYKFILAPKEENKSTKDILIGLCREEHVDCMVVGTFGTKDQRTVLGSTAEFFVSAAHIPTVLVKPTSTITDLNKEPKEVFTKWCVPVSDHVDCKYALEQLPKYLKPNDRVTFLRINRGEHMLAGQKEDEDKLQTYYVDYFKEKGTKIVYIQRPVDENKTVAQTIVDFVWERNYDVACLVPSQKKKFTSRANSGTLANVLNQCPATVLTLKTPQLH